MIYFQNETDRLYKELTIHEKQKKQDEILDVYMKATYPDLRKCINLMQQNIYDGKLSIPNVAESSSADWQIKSIELFKSGDIKAARELIVKQIRQEEYEHFFTLCYLNLDWFGKTEEQQFEALFLINEGQYKHSCVADSEINLSSMLAKLSQIGK